MQLCPQNGQILSILMPNDLEDEGQGHPQSIGIKNLSGHMHTKFGGQAQIGPKLRNRHFFLYLNFEKPGTYVKLPYMNYISTKFEGHR